MKLESLSFFHLASRRMEWLGARQKVIAENVANADTPGFKARDVGTFSEMLDQKTTAAGMMVTSRDHIQGTVDVGPQVRVEEDQAAWLASSINGNTVVLEQEAMKANDVSENYRLAASLYRKGYELMTLAVTGIR